jgi:FkbM family methyltransferase
VKFGLVVLGAHFGVWLDDIIQKYKEDNILLVEPVPYNYKILKKNFEEFSNIHICTNAIYSSNKTDFFYYVKENSISKLRKHWASQIGSFKKQHILDHKSKRFKIEESDIIKEKVKFITFDNLVNKYSIDSIDRLQIDVEGSEYEILKSINLQKIKINSIFFETKHFDGTFKEGDKLEEIKNKLIENNYNIKQLDLENMIAEKNYL